MANIEACEVTDLPRGRGGRAGNGAYHTLSPLVHEREIEERRVDAAAKHQKPVDTTIRITIIGPTISLSRRPPAATSG